jgi:MoxR-like ATPase
VLLADEINRATPKAQSALLEAMEERQVTVEGETRPLPEPFFVIATQNPLFQIGTFPLPESQLDRFLMRIRLGYPAAEQEKALLAGEDRRLLVARQAPALTTRQLLDLQQEVMGVHAAPAIIEYVHAILQLTRASERFLHGLSPRAGLGLLRAAKAWALLDDRDFVIPEDVQAVLPSVVGHRLMAADSGGRLEESTLVRAILDQVPLA